ncbi:MAG: nitroreductase family protein [Clostridium sp.]|nr:nitroreductase family protein [Clostridium sp.]
MNETLNTLLTRRSTRKFLNKEIPEEDLQQIIQAALHAPSGMGRQSWQFTLVKNREKIQTLAAAIERILNRPGYDMYRPQVLLIPSNKKESPYGREDDACALENIFLAAHSMGIGSVWINQLQGICDQPEIREILTSFGIPEDHVIYGMAALGYAGDEKAPKERIGKVVVVE